MKMTSAMRPGFSDSDAKNSDAVSDSLSRNRQPLVVDVDEVLARAQNGREKAATRFKVFISHSVDRLKRRGRSYQRTARSSHFDPAQALFNEDVISLLLRVVGQGRPVYLCSEVYHGPFVDSVAEHLGVFTAWSANDGHSMNDISAFPAGLHRGFEYLGSRVDLPDSVSRVARPSEIAETPNPGVNARTFAKLLRVHQYAKNALVLVPLLTAHKFDLVSLSAALLAVIAFSLAASGTYILNDLLDIKADRAHATKCNRPIASGAVSRQYAICIMVIALIAGLTIANSVSFAFGGVLLGYVALTSAYSFWLKRMAVIDIVALAVLYTMRVFGGAVAIGVSMSEWLFAFSLFIFMSLALVKRYVELIGQPQENVLAARDYRIADAPMIAVLAAAAGFNAVVIFTLYISSETIRALYSHPQLLWMNCPILMYWIGRVMLLAQRGLIHDDPIIFALKDRASWTVLGTVAAIMLAAI
jgi:4-hydroxybenzoate polyprenyltransferase